MLVFFKEVHVCIFSLFFFGEGRCFEMFADDMGGFGFRLRLVVENSF